VAASAVPLPGAGSVPDGLRIEGSAVSADCAVAIDVGASLRRRIERRRPGPRAPHRGQRRGGPQHHLGGRRIEGAVGEKDVPDFAVGRGSDVTLLAAVRHVEGPVPQVVGVRAARADRCMARRAGRWSPGVAAETGDARGAAGGIGAVALLANPEFVFVVAQHPAVQLGGRRIEDAAAVNG